MTLFLSSDLPHMATSLVPLYDTADGNVHAAASAMLTVNSVDPATELQVTAPLLLATQPQDHYPHMLAQRPVQGALHQQNMAGLLMAAGQVEGEVDIHDGGRKGAKPRKRKADATDGRQAGGGAKNAKMPLRTATFEAVNTMLQEGNQETIAGQPNEFVPPLKLLELIKSNSIGKGWETRIWDCALCACTCQYFKADRGQLQYVPDPEPSAGVNVIAA
jgi:hypothetical protein